MGIGLKCGFLPEQDCLKANCPFKAWVEDDLVSPSNEDETRGMCIFDIAAITIKRVVSGTQKLAHVVKGMSRDELIQKGVEIWKRLNLG